MLVNNEDWLITTVVSHCVERTLYLDVDHAEDPQDDHNTNYHVTTNSHILVDGKLPGTILQLEYSSIELFQNLNLFPPLILEQLFYRVIDGGTVIIPDTPPNRSHLEQLSPDRIKDSFSLKSYTKVEAKSKLFESIEKSKMAIAARLPSQTFRWGSYVWASSLHFHQNNNLLGPPLRYENYISHPVIVIIR